MRKIRYVLALMVCVCAAAAPPALAQTATATLSGTVADDTGAGVPGADVRVVNVNTMFQRQVRTGGQGLFVVPLLPPGRYSVRVQRTGFTSVNVPDVQLNVNDQIALTIRMKIAGVGETVTVAGASSRTSTSPAVATVIDRQFVENLPLNGRSFQSLLLLTPGVTMTLTLGQFSVNGQRSNANYFTVDGVSANMGVPPTGPVGDNHGSTNQYQAGLLPGLTALGGTQGLVSVDGLEEFKIQTSTYSAEFGRQPGGQVQLVTRSGTNLWQGSAFGSFRDDSFDANDWFANRGHLEKGEFGQQLFGGTLGGPAWRDRTFFFVSYEGLRLTQPATAVLTEPSPWLRAAAVPAVRQLLNAFPIPDGPELLDENGQPSGFAQLTARYANPKQHDATSVRLDHEISQALKVFGRYSRTPSNDGQRNGSLLIRSTANTQSLTMGVTFAPGGRMTNDLRANYSDGIGQERVTLTDFAGAVPIDVSVLTSGYSGNGRRSGSVNLNWGTGGSGLSLGEEERAYQRQINIVDTLSLVLGSHLVKLGVDFRYMTPSSDMNDYYQSTTFNDRASLLNGIANEYEVNRRPRVRPRFTNISAYAQDTWKATSRLTIDLGVRWDVNPPPREGSGLTPILLENVTGPEDVANARLAPTGTPLYYTNWLAFAPRVGAAWQIDSTPGRETVLRGGAGMFYDLGNGQATLGYNFYPYRYGRELQNVPFPLDPALADLGPPREITFPLWHDLPVLNRDLKPPYTLQWNLSVERAFGASQTVTASYVAAAGRRLISTRLLNGSPGYLSGSPEPLPRQNPDFADMLFTTNGPTSDYHALQVQARRRLSRGFQALASYTWGHAIDEVSSENWLYGSIERGNADFDVRHNLSVAATFDLPSPARSPLRRLLGGWSVDAIAHVQSGSPVEVISQNATGAGGVYVAVRPDVVPGVPFYLDDPGVPGGRRFNAAAFEMVPGDPVTGEALRQGTLGRNVLRGLPQHQIDLSLRRQVAIGPRLKVELRVDAFNLFNHPNFGSYDTNFTIPSTFGLPRKMLNGSLVGLNPLYQIGGPRSMQFTVKTRF